MGRNTAVALCFVVCVGCIDSGRTVTEVDSTSNDVGCKPEAPVDIAVTHRVIAESTYRVELVGTPRGDVEAVDLMLVLPDTASIVAGDRRKLFGATRSGISRAIRADIRVDSPGATIAASARVRFGGTSPSKLVEVQLGAKQPRLEPPERTIAAGGELIDDEVQP